MALPFAAALGLGQAAIGGIQALIGGIGAAKAKKRADDAIQGIQTYTEDPLAMARLNAPLPGETEAKMDIAEAATGALSQAKSKKGGLLAIQGIQSRRNKQLQQLGVQRAQAKLSAEKGVMQERAKAFESRQQKQQLQANIALQNLAAQRAMLSQGLSGLTGGLSSAAYGYVNRTKDTTNQNTTTADTKKEDKPNPGVDNPY